MSTEITDPKAIEPPKEDKKKKVEEIPPEPKPDVNDKLMEELRKTKAQLKELNDKEKSRASEELKAAQKWQELADLKEKEANEAVAERDKLKSAFVIKEKLSAFKEAAIAAGLVKESVSDLRPVDFPEIQLQTNSEGEITVIGADKAVQRLKSMRPHWFKTGAPKVNTNSPTVTGGGEKVTYEQIKKLQDDYTKNPNPANADKYKGALLEFKKQSRA